MFFGGNRGAQGLGQRFVYQFVDFLHKYELNHSLRRVKVAAHLFRELDKIISGPVRTRPAHEQSANGKVNENELEQTAEGVILVRGFNVADDGRRARKVHEGVPDVCDGLRGGGKEQRQPSGREG